MGKLRRWVSIRVEAPNTVPAENVRRLLALARQQAANRGGGSSPTVLVIGGGEMGFGLEDLYASPDVDVLAFDIYVSPLTQFVADAHHIPLASESVDAVVVQAVLEHVLEPWTVVEEIHRVLRRGGVVYSDVPFLYPVHEGPYDFMRFTDSGHRALYRDFSVIDSGIVRGSGTYLSWSIITFVNSLTRWRPSGWVARLLSMWIPRLDRVVDRRRSLDAAASVFLLGEKSPVRASPRQLVTYYQGAQVPNWARTISARDRRAGSDPSDESGTGGPAPGASSPTSRPGESRKRGSEGRRRRPTTPAADPVG